MTDIEYMKKAFEQAQKAYSKDEVPIGACLVDPVSKKIISKAHNQTEYGQDITAHAEILVLRKACKKLKSKRLWGLDLYVTLEPCTMCAAAISFARIRRVIYGAADEKGGGIENGAKFYQIKTCHHKPEVTSGVLAQECSDLLKKFFREKR